MPDEPAAASEDDEVSAGSVAPPATSLGGVAATAGDAVLPVAPVVLLAARVGNTVGWAEEGATLDVDASEAAVVELDVDRGSVGLDVDLVDDGELDPGDRSARSHTYGL